MHTSVSKRIIENWLDALTNSEVDPSTIELFRDLASVKELQNPSKLKEVISAIEDRYAKSQKPQG